MSAVSNVLLLLLQLARAQKKTTVLRSRRNLVDDVRADLYRVVILRSKKIGKVQV